MAECVWWMRRQQDHFLKRGSFGGDGLCMHSAGPEFCPWQLTGGRNNLRIFGKGQKKGRECVLCIRKDLFVPKTADNIQLTGPVV